MLRKNIAGQNIGFVLVNATTGAAVTGASVTAYRVVDGGAQAPVTGAVNEKGNGQYGLTTSAADTNGNEVSFLFVATGAIPVEKTVVTTVADPTSVDPVIALINAIPNGFIPGTISTATSGTSFIVLFGGAITPQLVAAFQGLWCLFSIAGRSPEKLVIDSAAYVDSTHATLSFASPGFSVPPQLNDAVFIG